MNSAEHQRENDLFIYLIETGVPLSEALNVEWGDIVMPNQTLLQETAEKIRPGTKLLLQNIGITNLIECCRYLGNIG